MAKNVHARSLFEHSENHSMGDSSKNPITHFESSTVNVGFNKDHLSSDNINDNNKLSPLLVPSPTLQPPQSPPLSLTLAISNELDVPPHKPNEQVQSQPVFVSLNKKPKGRPLGSKNKPKPSMEVPIPATLFLQEKKDFLEPIFLIVPGGTNIINSIMKFTRDKNVSISVHHASGLISEVNLLNPVSPADDLTFRGNLQMTSLSGFYTNICQNNIRPSLTIQFSKGKSYQLFGGLVGRKLITAEPMQVMAFITKNHEHHKMMHPIPPSLTAVEEYMAQLKALVEANLK